ncbi:MAG: tRNA (adenosine(37)-N6)-threonylcarbamoyltransferase complex dimerization subunit type 1 TsaB [bacterium]
MKILAVETTGPRESVAVYNDGKTTEIGQDVKSHSAHLLRNIDKVLKKANAKLEDLDYLAASIGPGSFMGIRIGLSTMQGLSLALGIPLIGVPTLDALAEKVLCLLPPHGIGLKCVGNNIKYICPLILSKGEDIYTAVYVIKNNKLKRIGKYQYMQVNEFLEIFRKDKMHGCVVFLGEAKRFENYIIDILGEKAFILQNEFSFPRAGNVALLAAKSIEKKKVKKIVCPSPLYVKTFLTKRTG